ncbi:MAG: HAD-IIIA family hydrolase [Ignavibacteria bacterium]|nr:HAD-IIIA family hydrolase [Ignavibacteria bacterium]
MPKPFSKESLSKIEVLLMDLDGCLTTGHIVYLSSGEDLKIFHTHDGYGITRGKKLGLKFGVISGMSSLVNQRRVERLKIDHLYQDVDDKTLPYKELKEMYGLQDENFAYIGDDEFDIGLLKLVGFSACPKNAMEEVTKHVDYVCKKDGGQGCVREIIDMILKAKGLI